MTDEEYGRLPAYKKEDHIYLHNNKLYKGDVLEVHALQKQINYLKVIETTSKNTVLLHECDDNFQLTENYQIGFIEQNISDIISKIDKEGIFRIFKPSEERILKENIQLTKKK